jgi:DNA-binding winged helix-turn-helix (wHTH) protein
VNVIHNVEVEESGNELTIKSPAHSVGSFCVTFSDVRVYPRARKLRVAGKPVEINNCAFEILLMLIEADGQIVSQRDLFRRLWPSTCVAKTNLRVQMHKLRRALRDNAEAIRTAHNRGYWLAVPITLSADPGTGPVPAPSGPEAPASVADDHIVLNMRLGV